MLAVIRLLAVLVLLGAKADEQPISAEDRLKLAESAMLYQDHKKTVELLEPALYPEPSIQDQKLLAKAWEYLGAAHFWLGDVTAFNREMTSYLMIDPKAELDPFYYPPDMVMAFNTLRDRLLEMGVIGRADAPKKEEKPAEAMAVLVKKTRTELDPMSCWLPFGVAQFSENRAMSGAFFFTTQVLALGVNAGSWAYMSMNDGGGSLRGEAIVTMYGSLAVFAGLWIAGIIDAKSHFRQFEETEERSLVPASKLAPAEPKAGH